MQWCWLNGRLFESSYPHNTHDDGDDNSEAANDYTHIFVLGISPPSTDGVDQFGGYCEVVK